ncbi:very short patch repair endonuclease [Elizabethkingia anophelis]|nr:very short patch repair endonuclease [Elizabethkingia anophelis]MCT4275598.1 very short patch repair endonuclease [Elizabethkingia anophelis]MCT4278384.1 very short patch repair endonuclease [Elizabethkingia anophelis]
MDNLTPQQRRKNMQAIKSKETKEEVLLAKALWNMGYRYRKNNNKIFGKPDITFCKYKIAIFVDGEFFHGKDWKNQRKKIKTNKDYWIPKIERNIQRDKEVTEYLLSNNWKVIRFWSREVKKNLSSCLEIIQQEISTIKNN